MIDHDEMCMARTVCKFVFLDLGEEGAIRMSINIFLLATPIRFRCGMVISAVI